MWGTCWGQVGIFGGQCAVSVQGIDVGAASVQGIGVCAASV